jgi:hypothetical protein
MVEVCMDILLDYKGILTVREMQKLIDNLTNDLTSKTYDRLMELENKTGIVLLGSPSYNKMKSEV